MWPVWCPITTACIYLNKISWLVFRKEMNCVFCEVKLKNNQVFKDAPSTSDFPCQYHPAIAPYSSYFEH